jgi:nucleoside-diphosphate-sugar epimerase
MGELGSEALAAYRQTNVAGTKAIIDAMSRAGVRRLVYVSSIKALGERSDSIALKPSDPKRPEDPYGISKAEAEDAVLAAHAVGQIDAVIVRPVLVHGPGAKGNLERLLGALARGRPLPLGAVRNRRSMVGVGNLADALLTAAMAPLGKTDESQSTPGRTEVHPPSRLKSAPPVYHIADDGVISTRRLVEVLAEGLGVRPRLVSVPRWLAVGGATLLGKGAMARRLFDDLEVDDSDFRLDFAWRPAIDLEDGLRLMAEDFARRQRDGSAT